MPRKVTAYSCSYGCGARVNTSKKAVEKHEKTCFSNEDNKACKTCHYNWYCDDAGKFACELDLIDNEKPKSNCDSWKSARSKGESF